MYRMCCTWLFLSRYFCTEIDMTERPNERISQAIGRALAEGPFTIQQLADEAGISYDTLYSWVKGRRVPRPENVRQLASGLEKRADLLREIAEDLKDAVESENP
jgi:transcriptional regulator with XRE-family HTH domain